MPPWPSMPIWHAARGAIPARSDQAIHAALAACRGNWAAAARRLAMDPSNLHKLARRPGIKR
ncbi:helix-turn-helix domain-containing protein [Halomonas sp. LBP4]|nr:helix-turn-helix domain-containing protein [Halomonas sp. LBP4]